MSDLRIKTFSELVGKTIEKVEDVGPDDFRLFYKKITFTDKSRMEVHGSVCWSEGHLIRD